MAFQRVCFLNAGSCTQLAYLAGRPSWGLTRFPAVFVYLEHPRHGVALIDTGYSPWFRRATESFPERFYRWATPLHLDRHKHAAAILAARGLAPERVERIFVSHFHGDHIAGLRHFPQARFVHRPAALELLRRTSVWGQVHQAFLARLLPEDFAARGDPVSEAAFTAGDGPLEELQVCDYWGDGDLLLVDLPGHAVGHTGFVVRTATERIFYVVDACWDRDVLLQGRTLPRLSQRVQYAYGAYVATQERLRRLAARTDWLLLACHCPRTQAHVANA